MTISYPFSSSSELHFDGGASINGCPACWIREIMFNDNDTENGISCLLEISLASAFNLKYVFRGILFRGWFNFPEPLNFNLD